MHHTVSLNDYTPDEAPQIVLAICRYHRNSNGWNDIGYNALVDKYGTIYEGRAGGLDQAVIGAHAQGFNSQTAGIANIGDYTSVGASQEALNGHGHLHPLEARRARPAAVGTRSRSRAREGPQAATPRARSVTLERVIGHRDTGKTSCPGDALYAQLDEHPGDGGVGQPRSPSLLRASDRRARRHSAWTTARSCR